MRLLASPGQRNDITLAHDLIAGFEPEAVLGDKGYDADPLAEAVETRGAAVVITPKRNRKNPRAYDHDLYKECNKIKRFFNKLKQFRRVATRY